MIEHTQKDLKQADEFRRLLSSSSLIGEYFQKEFNFVWRIC